jgi:hypothetical protein
MHTTRFFSSLLQGFFLIALISCDRFVSDPPPLKETMPYFNQVNTNFGVDQIQCLLDQWYALKYEDEPVKLQVINDSTHYRTFFACKSGISLPPIDFATQTLLVGMKARYTNPSNTPVNITAMTQNLVKNENGSYTLEVTISGRATANNQGGEWFGFTSAVSKIQSPVDLELSYIFE